MTAALHAYERALEPTRRRVTELGQLRGLLSSKTSDAPSQLHAFLIQWTSLSVQLHEPNEQFLADASQRCAELGETKLALTLLHIALDAIDVYRLLADDTRTLAHLWNGRRLPRLDMTSLLTQPITQAIRRCYEHQTQLVFGAEPWAELAAMFEVHTLFASLADDLVAAATRLLGEDARAGLRTLHALKQARSNSLLTTAMQTVLTTHPERHADMVAAGQRTLELYAEFVLECLVAGFNLSSWQSRQRVAATSF